LSIIQEGRPEAPRSDGHRALERAHHGTDPSAEPPRHHRLWATFPTPPPEWLKLLGFRYKPMPGHYLGPHIEPFDQAQAPPHFDVFLRRDRLVVFITATRLLRRYVRPYLDHDYGLVTYGDLIYHGARVAGGLQRQCGAVSSSTERPSPAAAVWIAIYESDGFTDIPPQFATFQSRRLLQAQNHGSAVVRSINPRGPG